MNYAIIERVIDFLNSLAAAGYSYESRRSQLDSLIQISNDPDTNTAYFIDLCHEFLKNLRGDLINLVNSHKDYSQLYCGTSDLLWNAFDRLIENLKQLKRQIIQDLGEIRY